MHFFLSLFGGGFSLNSTWGSFPPPHTGRKISAKIEFSVIFLLIVWTDSLISFTVLYDFHSTPSATIH